MTDDMQKMVELMVRTYLLDHADFLKDLSDDNKKDGNLDQAIDCIRLARSCIEIVDTIKNIRT